MPFPSPFRRLALVASCLALAAGSARADLAWNSQTGWEIQGGALSGLTGAQGRTALDLMNRARRAEEKHRVRLALKLYTRVTKRYPSSVYAPEAFFRIGLLRLGTRQYYKSFAAFQDIIAHYPNVQKFDEVIGEQYHVATLLMNGARNRLWGKIPLFTNRERGIAYCAAVVSNAPYGDYAPLALMIGARGQQYVGETELAIDSLDNLVNTYPQSVITPDAYLQLGKLHASLVEGPYYDQGETKQAITYFEDFMILYPGDSNIKSAAEGLEKMKTTLAESKIRIGDFYFYKRSNYVAARVFYNEAITSYPDSDVARRAKLRLAAVDAKAAAAANPAAQKKRHFLFF